MELKEAFHTALELMVKYNLEGWQFKFDRSKRRFGRCDYRNKVISLSTDLTLLNSRNEVYKTIVHEIAHALCPKAGHGIIWKRKMLELGCEPERCYKSDEVTQPEKKFIGTCPKCNTQIKKHRRRRTACRKCCLIYNNGKFATEFLFIWRENYVA